MGTKRLKRDALSNPHPGAPSCEVRSSALASRRRTLRWLGQTRTDAHFTKSPAGAPTGLLLPATSGGISLSSHQVASPRRNAMQRAKIARPRCRCNGHTDEGFRMGDSCKDWTQSGYTWCFVDSGACSDARQSASGLWSRQACTSSALQRKKMNQWFYSAKEFSWGTGWKNEIESSKWVLRCKSSVPWIPPKRAAHVSQLQEKLQHVLDNISAMAGGEGLSLGIAFGDNGQSMQLTSGLVKPWRGGREPNFVRPHNRFAFGILSRIIARSINHTHARTARDHTGPHRTAPHYHASTARNLSQV